MKPAIVVLEDMRVRVDWLKSILGDTVALRWHTTVADFVADLRTHEDVALVIMDHDIPPPSAQWEGLIQTVDMEKDENGQNGADAAREMPFVRCPILVWSANVPCAASMVSILRGRGMAAEHYSFIWARSTLANRILDVVT